MFARSINFVESWTEMHESSINNLSKDHCTTSAIFVLRVSAKPTACGRSGDVPPTRTAALLRNPALKQKALSGTQNLPDCSVLNSLA